MNIEAEKDESVIKNAFQKVQKVILKVIEENRVALELFEQETEKATKKGLFVFCSSKICIFYCNAIWFTNYRS